MTIVLRLLEDVLKAGETATATAALPRAIYVAAGRAKIDGEELSRDAGTVMLGSLPVEAGPEGACLWRYEVAPAAAGIEEIGPSTRLKLQADIFASDVSDSHLLRLDSVAFPPGGCAYLHTHQGPGIRCLLDGRIRIDAEGHSASFGPGSPWFEAGPDPVFAQADQEKPTRFIRASVLPKELLGQSSIRYVNAEDLDKPKSQSYQGYGERLLGDR